MKKPKSVAQLKKEADKFYSQYIRLRDADRNGVGLCITCGVKKPWKELQNGHFVKRSVNSLRFNDENCNAQCYSCNVMKYGEQYKYAQEIDFKYGVGTAEKLYARRFETHKFSAQELLDIIEQAKSNIKTYESYN